MRCGPAQPTDILQTGTPTMVDVPDGATVVTVYGPAAALGVLLALGWLENRTPANLTSDWTTTHTGATGRINIPAGANVLRITATAPCRVWLAWSVD